MASLANVERLDVVEDGVGELQAGAPAPAVEQLGLHARPEALHHGVVTGVPDRTECGH